MQPASDPPANQPDNASRCSRGPLFNMGQIVATPGALALLERHGQGPQTFLARHVCGDWGEVPREDALANNAALGDDTRILSSYWVQGNGQAAREKLWLITDAGHRTGFTVTTLLMPEEY
jgi:hypothetical protein